MQVHYVSLKGKRNTNEDAHTIILKSRNKQDGNGNKNEPKINYYGLYDGHGGKFVSKYLGDNMYKHFVKNDVEYPLTKEYVNNIYDGVRDELFTKYVAESTECGSTCLVVCDFVLQNRRMLNVMNTGDSRAVMCRNQIGIPLTLDHKPDWPMEKARISKLGGEIYEDKYGVHRINDLSVSRAFGDKSSSKYVTHRPDIYRYEVTKKDQFMIMGCDGLWDEVSAQDAVNFVLNNCYDVNMRRINKEMNIAKKLGEYAIIEGSMDNVTIIIVFFD